jgi:hypothetical protein
MLYLRKKGEEKKNLLSKRPTFHRRGNTHLFSDLAVAAREARALFAEQINTNKAVACSGHR